MSTTKNQLSSILAEVKRGETYLIVDRDVPVARLKPLAGAGEKIESLAAAGLVRLPERNLTVEAFLGEPRPRVTAGRSASEALSADREESR